MDNESKLSFDPIENGFVLRRNAPDGNITTLELTEADVLTLSELVAALRHQILSRHDKSEQLRPVVAIEIDAAEAQMDVLQQRILVSLSRGNFQAIYALSLLASVQLSQRLAGPIERLRISNPHRH